MNIKDTFASHLPVLTHIINNQVTKPILELGSGFYSTPIIHDFLVKNKIEGTIKTKIKIF
jgi:hypothetical protein